MNSYNVDAKLLKEISNMTRKELNYEISRTNKIIKRAGNNYNKKFRERENMKKEDKK